MCGIAGMASFDRPVSEAVVRRMTATLTHRGPDEDGFYAAAHATVRRRSGRRASASSTSRAATSRSAPRMGA